MFTVVRVLLLGAVVNFAVAWSYFTINRNRIAQPVRDVEMDVILQTHRIMAFDEDEFGEASGLAYSYAYRDCSRNGESCSVWDLSVGWPVPALGNPLTDRPVIWWNRRGVPQWRQSPLWRPVWPGFALNTALYAGMLWLAFPGRRLWRCHLRRKRGRCPDCGYDLRGDLATGCPECGWNREKAEA
ncbi:MAG: hypothetical protein JSV91_06570 [Phycisphaerales bacterium]|nr:MAG: hypothetical protein JSV91_06570 [Phycisphaerales bacterium]